jgi:hypothetical protein
MLIDTGRRLGWTFLGLTLPSHQSVPNPEWLTRELRVFYSDEHEAERRRAGALTFQDALPALEDPRLRVFHHQAFPHPGQEFHQDYVLGRLGQRGWVLIELVLRERANEEAGYLLEIVEVLDARTHPDWLAEYQAKTRKKKARS